MRPFFLYGACGLNGVHLSTRVGCSKLPFIRIPRCVDERNIRPRYAHSIRAIAPVLIQGAKVVRFSTCRLRVFPIGVGDAVFCFGLFPKKKAN